MARAPLISIVFPFYQERNGITSYAIFNRSDSEDDFWQAISGGGEGKESSIEAAKREAWEEARISRDSKFIALDSLATVPVTDLSRRELWGENTLVIPQYSFGVEVETKFLTLSEEHTEYRWCNYDEAMELLKFDSNKTALWELNERLSRGESASSIA